MAHNPDDPRNAGKNIETADLKTREQWLRDEVKNHRALLLSLIQWGMALLLAVESALYFIRQEVAQGLTGEQFIVPAKVLSWGQWFYGTSLQITIALLFSALTLNLLKRYYKYRIQLLAIARVYSKIDDSSVKKGYQWIPLLFFWAIPTIDQIIWFGSHK
jgi:hypothetical protein